MVVAGARVSDELATRVTALELRVLQLDEAVKLMMFAMGVRPAALNVSEGSPESDALTDATAPVVVEAEGPPLYIRPRP